MKEEYYSIQKAAEWLGVSPTTLRRWEERGVLVPERTHGNQRRYALSKLQAFKGDINISAIQPQNIPAPTTALDNPQVNEEYISPIAKLPIQDYLPVLSKDSSNAVNEDAAMTEAVTDITKQKELSELQTMIQKTKPSFFSINAGTVTAALIVACLMITTLYFFSNSSLVQGVNDTKTQKTTANAVKNQGNSLKGDILFNLPSIFNGSVQIKNSFVVNGKSLFTEDIKVDNKNVDLGSGKLTASNVVYGLTAGANITITGDPQNPTISAADTAVGVESFQGESGIITLTEGDGIGLDGLTITNTGVLSLGGETGDVELTAGEGISVNGTEISNDDPGSAQNIFKNIIVDAETIIADSNDDTLTFEAGSGIVLTPDPLTKKLTITSNASGTLAGLITNGVMYATSATNASSTAPGTTGTVLKGVTGGAPVFGAVSLAADVTGTLGVSNGGTGNTSTPTSGQLLIGNGSGYTLGTITAGSGIGIGNGAGTVTVTNNGVLSLSGTANQVSVSGATGSITVSLPQNIHTAASPTFASMTFTNNTNQLVLGSGNTGTITMAALTSGQTYTLPDDSGEICLSTGNCPSLGGGTIDGSGTTNYLAKFTNTNDIGNSLIYDTGQKVGIGTISPQGLFSVSGGSTGTALVSLNETGDQNILVGSASGTTRFVFDRSGNLNLVGGGYQISGNTVISATALGNNVVTSSLTSVGTLGNGSIASGFGSIDTGTDAISGGDITATGGTGFSATGNEADLTFSGTGNHLISASSGTLQLGAVTLNGVVTGNNQSITGLNSLAASGTITFGAFTSNGGILYTNGSGQLTQVAAGTSTQVLKGGVTPSFGAVDLGTDVNGTLPVTNGGTGLNTVTTGDLIYASGADTLGRRAIGSPGQILTVQGGVPVWADPGGATNYWQRGDGTVAPNIITDDLLLGSAATGSAKFAFMNVGTGTPTASISAGTGNNATFLSGNGILGTTNAQTLTLGNTSTGNIVLDSGSGIITLADATVLSSNMTVGGITLLNGAFTLGDSGDNGSINTSDWDISTTGEMTGITNITNDGSYTQTGTAQNTFSGNVDATNGLDVTGADLTIGGTNATITTAGVITGTTINATTGIQTGSTTRIDNSGNILNIAGISTSLTPTAANTYSLGTAIGNQYSTIYGQTLYQNGNQVCDTGGNCSGLTTTYWNQANGAISAKNTTVDVLVGGTSTSSAKFAVLNVNSGVPTASVSAGSTGGAYITADGTFSTTNAQTLTLGSVNTGNVIIESGSGSISLADATSISGNLDALNGLDVTGASLTVGGSNASISLTGVITGTTINATTGIQTNSTTRIDNNGNLSSIGTIDSTYFDVTSNNVNLAASTTLSFNGSTVINASRQLQNIAGVGTNLNPTATNTYSLGASGNQYLNIYGQTLYQGGNQVCDTSGNCSGLTTTYWNQADGALSTKNTTVDLLVGGTSTASAKFAVLNVNSGTPTASLSGATGGTYLAANGSLQTTNNQTLTIGGTTTGNLLLDAGSGLVTIADATTITGNLDANNGLDVTGASLTVGGSNASISLTGVITGTTINATTGIQTNSTTRIDNNGNLANIGTIDSTYLDATTNNVNLAASTTLSMNGNTILDASRNLQNIAGVTTDLIPTANNTYDLGSNANRFAEIHGQTLYQGGNQVCDLSGNCAGLTTTYWNQADGALSTKNTTVDLLVGGTSTASAKFAILNVNSGTPIASLSAGGNNATYLSATGTLSTTNAQTLTLGGGTSGNVIIDSGSGLISLLDALSLNGNFTQVGSGTFTTATGSVFLNGDTTIQSDNTFTIAALTTNGGLLYTNGSGTVAQTAAGNAGQILRSNGSGTPTWVDAASVGTNYWQQNAGTVSPINITNDLLLGGTATNSAKFAFINNVGSGTPTASISGSTANNALYITGDGTLATTNKQTLTIGSATTGNIALNGFGAGFVRTNASGVLSSSGITLGTDTDGNYVQSVTGGSGIAVSGSAGEGWTPTLALGNLSTDWDQTAAFDIILNNASSELRIREASGSFFGTLDVADLDGDKT